MKQLLKVCVVGFPVVVYAHFVLRAPGGLRWKKKRKGKIVFYECSCPPSFLLSKKKERKKNQKSFCALSYKRNHQVLFLGKNVGVALFDANQKSSRKVGMGWWWCADDTK